MGASRLDVGACVLLAFAWSTTDACAQVVVKDETSFLELTVPVGWTVSQTFDKDESKYLHQNALSPDRTQALYVYVFQADDEIDLQKLADTDVKLGWALGERSSEVSINPSTMRRTYERGPKGLYATALFRTEGPFGYLLLAASTSSDLKFADASFGTVTVNLPLTKRLWGGMWSVLGWLGGLAGVVLFWGVFNVLGRAGSWIRRGVETKKALQIARRDARAKGLVLNEKFQAASRKSTVSILAPVAGLLAVFVTAFSVLSIGQALVTSLVLVIAPALGYIGILLGPSADLDDYLPD